MLSSRTPRKMTSARRCVGEGADVLSNGVGRVAVQGFPYARRCRIRHRSSSLRAEYPSRPCETSLRAFILCASQHSKTEHRRPLPALLCEGSGGGLGRMHGYRTDIRPDLCRERLRPIWQDPGVFPQGHFILRLDPRGGADRMASTGDSRRSATCNTCDRGVRRADENAPAGRKRRLRQHEMALVFPSHRKNMTMSDEVLGSGTT